MEILVFGPKLHKSGRSGGVVVLFNLFLVELDNNNVKYIVIDTNKKNYRNKIIALISIFFDFFRYVFSSSHVSFHGTAADFKHIAPIIVLFSRLLGKHVSLRKFAGSFIEVYKESHDFHKILIRFTLSKSNLVCFETKYLVNYFKRFNENTIWFPNVRQNIPSSQVKSYSNRFIFLGHIAREKGILVLIDAVNQLSDEFTLDLYGELHELDLEDKISKSNASYMGVLNSADVLKVLQRYDVLVLPSYREGYPGVIIEAFSAGIPVIATRLEGIIEFVENKRNGYLIDPGDATQLVNAMNSFNVENISSFSRMSRDSFNKFDSSIVTKKYLEKIMYES
jgi:glycosyltransferase involved in cell wall biosynthesis